MKPTNEYIEEQILLMLDGELDDNAVAALEAHITRYPEFGELLESFRTVYLRPEPEIVFPGKEGLLRSEAPAAIRFRPAVKQLPRIAAAIAVLVMCVAVVRSVLVREHAAGPEVAATVTKVPQPVLPASSRPANPAAPSLTKQATAVRKEKAGPRQPNRSIPYNVPTGAQGRDEPAAPEPAHIARMETPVLRTVEVPVAVTAEALPREVMPAAATAPEPSGKSWLPVKEESLDGVQLLVAHIQAVKDNIALKAKELRRANFVLRLGDQEINIGK